MDKLKLYMFAKEQHVFIHFMNFPPILVQLYFYPPTTGQTVKKLFFSWIYPFHEISCNFGSGVIFTPTPTHPPTGQTVKTIFFSIDLSISGNFLQFWFRYIFYPHPSQPNSGENFFFMDLSIS